MVPPRRDATPPQKSPAPKTTAEASANTMIMA